MVRMAPGAPGLPPKWTSSAKDGVGTALDTRSPVWFTLSHGILNEVYYPRVDRACTRDLGLLISDGAGFFSEEKRDTSTETTCPPGIPAYNLVSTCVAGRYQIEKTVIADPCRAVVLQRVRFTVRKGSGYRVYALLAPHLNNGGADNTAYLADYKGVPMLVAERDGHALALACSSGWAKRSAGFVATSDGWQDISQHGTMEWEYERAEHGNVALTGEIVLPGDGEFVLALGFGDTFEAAGQRALASLQDGFDVAYRLYVAGWEQWQKTLLPLDGTRPGAAGVQADLFRASAAVLRSHESVQFPGAIIASMSIPWGFNKGDDDLGGYHLVWPRDLVESAGALLAIGAAGDARRVLDYLQATQDGDGHWPQNMWLDGRPYWSGLQMDETAFPILLLELLWKGGALRREELPRYWPMVRRATAYLVQNGPVTGQDRWEEDPGYSPFTLAAEVAALLVAAGIAEECGEPDLAPFLRDTADTWNDSIERWTYVEGTELARRVGVDGYYIRIAPLDTEFAASPKHGFVPIKNRPPDSSQAAADEVIGTEFLALVRFGLRAPDDPRIVNTIKVVDAVLKVEMPQGPLWHRYNGDGYGEHEDGRPFDGCGVGRTWPLLAGERGHYELAAGRAQEAGHLLETMRLSAGGAGLIPEQSWDAPDIPERELRFGRPSGAARPLVWAHAEYVKLLRSLRDDAVFDTPACAVERYVKQRRTSAYAMTALNNRLRSFPRGKTLRLKLPEPASVHWSTDNWATASDTPTRDTGLGVHIADLPTENMKSGDFVVLTLFWPARQQWEGADYSIACV